MGNFSGKIANNKMYDKQYFEPKYGKYKNFFTRNIYLDPIKKEKMQQQREISYTITKITTEVLIKGGCRIATNLLSEKDAYDKYSQIYSLIHNFAISDPMPNNDMVKIELNKIRNSFQLSPSNKIKLRNAFNNKNAQQLQNLDLPFIFNANSDVRNNIAYLLYSIAYLKYDNDTERNAALKKYYFLLGFHASHANELLREHANTYSSIINDQHKLNVIAQQMVSKIFVDIPTINIEDTIKRAHEIAKFDPYSLRRKKVQDTTKKAATEGVKVAMDVLVTKYPEISCLAMSEALSQFNLSDDMKETPLYNFIHGNQMTEALIS